MYRKNSINRHIVNGLNFNQKKKKKKTQTYGKTKH